VRWLLVGLAAVALGATRAVAQPTAAFPHDKHAKLFPLCESCHMGVASGDAANAFPTEASCRDCHNGTDAKPVEWRRPARAAGLLRYSHPEHAAKVDSAGRECGACHGTSGAPRMVVHRATPESCLTCHTHQASAHLADDNRCGSCHVALTAARGLSRERVAALPRPPTHERANFISAHAPSTPLAALSCGTCHARQSCARCHVNASTQSIIAALAPDDRVAAVVAGKEAVYPTPADHELNDFAWEHGGLAREQGARCATCHTRPSCNACHTGTGWTDVLRQMPNAERGAAPGVRLEHRRTRAARVEPTREAAESRPQGVVHSVSVHEAGFLLAHKVQAGAAALECAGCHTQRFCSDCHTGEASGERRFHGANFAMSHAASAFAREAECAACHNAEAFCRSCHVQSGLASRGRLDVAYHTAQPQWLLQHGRAARQGLQNCTSCHVQRDCLTCHSTTGWGINPHGRDFDAASQAKRTPRTCLVCHLEVPRGRG
jgi:hypothetical protein